MTKRQVLELLLVPALLAGCSTARSMMIGEPAALVAPGQAEVAVGAGGEIVRGNVTQSAGAMGTSLTNDFSADVIPDVEGHLDFGLGDDVALELRGDVTGLQPGLKIALARGPIDVSFVPIASLSDSSVSASDASSQDTLGVLLGGKLLVSSRSSGVYAAAGIDYQRLSSSQGSIDFITGMPSTQTDAVTSDVLSAALGMTFATRTLLVRPELDFLYYVKFDQNISSSGSSMAQTNAFHAWAIVPSISLAWYSGGARRAAALGLSGVADGEPTGSAMGEEEIPVGRSGSPTEVAGRACARDEDCEGAGTCQIGVCVVTPPASPSPPAASPRAASPRAVSPPAASLPARSAASAPASRP